MKKTDRGEEVYWLVGLGRQERMERDDFDA